METLKEKYLKEIQPSLKKEFGYTSIMQVPKLEKIVLNMGVGDALADSKYLDVAVKELEVIAGQKPVITKAKKSIAGFKLREGNKIGCKVTLRGDNMYAFLEKLIDVVLPRVKDFRWVSKKSFDSEGNYNFGIKEHTIFPEVPQLDVVKFHWLQITIKTNTKNKEASRMLLEEIWIPFSK